MDATILHAPSSTKNSSGQRDPEMHQTKKGNQWYFGAKAHLGVDSKETVVHTVITSAASVADSLTLTLAQNTGQSTRIHFSASRSQH